MSDPTPPPGLSRLQIRRALRLWTVEGCVATVQISLTTGAFQTGFALFLRCTPFWIGALGAIPAIAGLVQLFSSYLAERYGSRKPLVLWFAFVSRLLWVPMLLIPFLLPPALWVASFLTLTFVSALLFNVSQPLWTAWITELVPEDNRGRYFGQRNMYAGWVGLLIPIAGGYFLDAATKQQAMSQPLAFAVIFGAATVFALGSFGLGLNSPDVPQAKLGADGQAQESALAYYRAPFADRNFQKILVYAAVIVVSQSIAGQFFTVYQLQYLHLSYTAYQLFTGISALTALGAMPLWGYLADKYGNKPILIICCGLIIVPPLLWTLAQPDGMAGLWRYDAHHLHLSLMKLDLILLNLFAGPGWAGVGLTGFNLVIGASPPEKRTVYVSAVAAVSGLAGGIAPLVGGAMMEALAHYPFSAHGWIRNNYDVLFVLSAVLRGAAMLLVSPIREVGSRRTSYVLKQLKASKPIGSFTGIQKLSRADNSQAKVQAAEALGRLKTPLAVEELVRALDDVSLSVREGAALALGEIRDPRATMPLVRKLTDPASGISGVAAVALGKIGDRTALPALAAAAQLGPPPRQLAAMEALGRLLDPSVTEILGNLMRDSDATVRTAAIRALAEREDPVSLPGLIAQLEGEREPANLAVLADALGRLGSADAIQPLLSALPRSGSPTVQREIWNALGSLGGGRDAFYPYLALETSAREETVGKILRNIQRRYRARTAQGKEPNAARIAALSKRALTAYSAGDNRLVVRRLARLARLLPPEIYPAAHELLVALNARALDPANAGSAEEALLAVFLIRRLAA